MVCFAQFTGHIVISILILSFCFEIVRFVYPLSGLSYVRLIAQ